MAPKSRLIVEKALEELAVERPIFHSEADFQHALAWQIQQQMPSITIRLEYRPLPEEPLYVDLWIQSPEETVAMELKYLTKKLEVEQDGERFSLRNQGAHDISAHDCWKDVVRLERFVTESGASMGYLIVLSNDPLYWRPPARPGAGYDAFRLNDGRHVSGILEWGSSIGLGTTRGREDPLVVTGDYRIRWQEYSQFGTARGGEFKVLVVEVGGKKSMYQGEVEEGVGEPGWMPDPEPDPGVEESAAVPMDADRWTIDHLHRALARFESQLRQAGLRESSIQTYIGRSDTFLRWLAGDYEPRGPNS